ncbi:hypothetical protein RHSIM_Rhsim13G0147800 [Rhododendron simsii]|uniref:Uncharacterized protein n=1 Tax=Rhododendron simsii TaxID=118357 RepID=A0A834G2R3_RHOSS|nr:hypothetical protein RHSIM_Rhsim13G0147800 [Rhododendron simsii]
MYFTGMHPNLIGHSSDTYVRIATCQKPHWSESTLPPHTPSFSKADDYESATTDEEEMVRDYDVGDSDRQGEFPLVVDVDNHIHVDVSGGGPEDDRVEDIETDENVETSAGAEQVIPRPVRGHRVNYRAHFQSEATLAKFLEVYRIPGDVTVQLVPLDQGVVDRLKARADAERKSRAYASPKRTAPKLLGHVPSYNTTLAALTPDPFSEGSTETPRAPFHPVDLEDRNHPSGCVSSGGLRRSKHRTRLGEPKMPPTRSGRRRLGEGSHTSVDPKRPIGLQVRQEHNVKDDPKIAFALMNGTLLPRDAQELPKDLEAALQQTTQNLAAMGDHLTDRNKHANELIKMRKDLKTQNDKLKAEKLLDAADAKGYQEGTADVTQHYTAQVEKLQDKACGVGYALGLKAAGVDKSSELYMTADVTPEPETPGENAEKTDSPTRLTNPPNP